MRDFERNLTRNSGAAARANAINEAARRPCFVEVVQVGREGVMRMPEADFSHGVFAHAPIIVERRQDIGAKVQLLECQGQEGLVVYKADRGANRVTKVAPAL